VIYQAREALDGFIFGNLAILATFGVEVDPWLCVPAFRRVCYFGYYLWIL